jgi:hypothetical protein
MTRLQELALAVVAALVGALACAAIFAALTADPDQIHVPVPIPQEYATP